MNSMTDPSPDRPGQLPDGSGVIAGPGRDRRVAAAVLLAGARWLPGARWQRLDFSDRAALGLTEDGRAEIVGGAARVLAEVVIEKMGKARQIGLCRLAITKRKHAEPGWTICSCPSYW